MWEGDLPAEFNNYLFAGSQDAAERTALFYSLIGSCKIVGVNPLAWLTNVIKNINNHPIQKLHLLLPSNWKTQQG
ncbi:ISSfl3 OrfD [Microscilla marina ATCC 23134]|uniref:ISSfl3 OrfD n=1 Tax=Microscilla marina ATCC 23134 TaxID=313606 RepID=A1ZX34_MICM2|nr:ISSfl3 OrfD [Microscilla marina ATCC 23134]